MGKKKETRIRKLFAGINQKVREAKIEAKHIQCDCPHKSKQGKLWIKKVKKGSDRVVFKCKECDDKTDLTPVVDKDQKEIRAYVKEVTNDFINLCNIGKITMSPKLDDKYLKLIGKAQFLAYQVKKVCKVTLTNVATGKKRRNRRKKRRNIIIGGRPSGLR